jgi:HlyD family secretion protein
VLDSAVMKKGRWRLLAVVLAVAAGAVWVVRSRGDEALVVDLDKAVRRPLLQSFVTASGEIVASRYADIGSSVFGRLVDLQVAEGGRVRRGQVLARIDPVQAESDAAAVTAQLRALEAEVEAARARSVETRQALARARALQTDGILPRSELDTAEAAADTARAQLGAAEKRAAQGRAQLRGAADALAKTEITAPMDGVVTRLSVREGEMVVVGIQNQPGTILMTLSDLATINAEVRVAEADVLRLKLDQPAVATLEAAPEREIAGRVVEIGASALPDIGIGAAAREFRAVVRLDDPDPSLRPGLTCDVRILAAEARNAVTVPLQAVVLRPGPDGKDRTGVFTVTATKTGKGGGTVRFTPVTLGIVGGLDVEVRGLPEGTRIVAGPFQALRELADGTAVEPRPPAGG